MNPILIFLLGIVVGAAIMFIGMVFSPRYPKVKYDLPYRDNTDNTDEHASAFTPPPPPTTDDIPKFLRRQAG